MLMPGRKYSSGKYRYGFNGKENDNEVKGDGNVQDYGMRVYDTRLGKFLSVDPLTKNFPWYTPYQFAGNIPIAKIDLDGSEPLDFRNNWVTKSMFVLSTKQQVGQEMLITDPKLGKDIDVEMVYDNWSKQVWFVHQDNTGNWLYLKNDNGVHTEMSIDPKTNTLKGGTFVPFETQDQLQGKYMRELVDGTGAAMAVIIATIAGGIAIDGALSTFGTKAVSDFVVNEVKDEIIDQTKESLGIIDLNIKDVKEIVDNAKDILRKKGREGGQDKLKEIVKDQKASSADKGWIQQELNEIDRGKRKTIRNPPGRDMAHERGREAAKGYSYKHSNLQTRELHRLQHKHDKNGRLNKERPIK